MVASNPEATEIVLFPDLNAVGLNVVATFANDMVNVSGIIDNVGFGSASGPFYVAISVTLYTPLEEISFSQMFEVPSSVTLYGRPVSVLLPLQERFGIFNPRPTSYQTPAMQVPLRFIDVDGSYYIADMLVDPYYQVSDPNRSNNYYSWPGKFWFMSLKLKEHKGPLIVKRSVASR